MRSSRGVFLVVLLLAGLPLTLGCAEKPSVVSGKVTVDGKPLQKGSISFLPAAGDGPSAGISVIDGNYTVEVFPGSKKVEITGYEVVGQVPAYGDPKGPMKDVTKSIVPPKYNLQSTLTAEIKKGANDGVNFELTSK